MPVSDVLTNHEILRLAPMLFGRIRWHRSFGGPGEAPFEWLEREMGRHGRLEVFVDTREMFNAVHAVAEGWSAWIKRHQTRLTRMNLLTASKYVHMTIEVAKLFSRTGELMRIYTQASAFSEALSHSVGRVFVLDAPPS
jgi:hypothetical protein